MLFEDRFDAAHQLATQLNHYKNRDDVVIIAIPRGGLQLGAVLAEHLNAPLDVFFTKKIGAPGNAEYAIGAVSLIDVLIAPEFDIPQMHPYLQQQIEEIRTLLKQRYQEYKGNQPPLKLHDKTVIVVDDGVATGNTLLLTLRMIQKQKPKKLIVALPVSPADTLKKIQQEADEVVCLQVPPVFYGVGGFYKKFPQVTDQEAIELLHSVETIP